MRQTQRWRSAWWLPLALSAPAFGAPSGCGTNRPALFDDFVAPASTGPVGAGSELNVGPPPVPTCNLGPDGGVCACADQALQLTDVPNIYFVLDRSASMSENGKWQTVVAVLSDLVVRIGPRANFGAAVFPAIDDPTGCTPGQEVFSPMRGDAPAGWEGPTARRLSAVLAELSPSGGTPTAATLALLKQSLSSLPGPTYVILATDGGPNCGDSGCDAGLCQNNIESIGATPTGGRCLPTGPNCCSAATPYGAESCLDAQPTIDAVQSLASSGIPVFVVGVPGSDVYANLLNELAVAGGTGREVASEAGVDAASANDTDAAFGDDAGEGGSDGGGDDGAFASDVSAGDDTEGDTDEGGGPLEDSSTDTGSVGSVDGAPNPAPLGPSTQYYAVTTTDQAALSSAMAAIAAKITATCTLTLSNVPPQPDLVNVFLDEKPVPQLAADGSANWTLDGNTATLVGATCANVLAGNVLDVRVVAGCPTVVR